MVARLFCSVNPAPSYNGKKESSGILLKQTRHPIYQGAFLLTASGLLCRFIGFYYKIFLSRVIGPKELGLYQLAMPLLAVGIAFSNSGIHTALSKYVAGEALHGQRAAARYLYAGLAMSLCLSAVFCIPCYLFTPKIAAFFFGEPTITPLLRILLLCVPLECIHGCINGYYYGLQKASVPSGGQCVEQFARIAGVFGMYFVLTSSGLPFTKRHAMLGLLIGEAVATLYYLTFLSLSADKRREDPAYAREEKRGSFFTLIRRLTALSLPVTANRLLMSGLNGMENILIPQKLTDFGMNRTQALSIYGIYSGMAMPMIFFPMVISNSIAVMLLPSIARAKEERRDSYIAHAVSLGFFLCMLLGFCCSFFFYFAGPFMGERIYHNTVAGIYIRTLSWLCPFLFLGATMNSILNGLGKTKDTFRLSVFGALIRLAFVQFGIRSFGFRAFLLGILVSQVSVSLLAFFGLTRIYTLPRNHRSPSACHTDNPE